MRGFRNVIRAVGWSVAIFLLAGLRPDAVFATAANYKMNYQGRLTDQSTGDPLTGSHNFIFRIKDAGDGSCDAGDALQWASATKAIVVSSGIVRTVLGETNGSGDWNSIDWNGIEACLEIVVDANAMTPLERLVATPYAMFASSAGAVAGTGASDNVFKSAGNVGIGTTSPGAKLHVLDGDVIIDRTSGISRLTLGASSGATPRFVFGGTSGGIFETTSYALSMRFASGASASSVDFEPAKVTFRTGGLGGFERITIDGSGNVGIGTTNPGAAALLEVASTSKGFLPPRMTEAQRDAISSPPAGLIVYNTTTNTLNMSTAAAAGSWVVVGPQGTWYKTSTTGNGSTPRTACAAGYHLCKSWEMNYDGRIWAGLGDATPFNNLEVWIDPRGLGTSALHCGDWTNGASGTGNSGFMADVGGIAGDSEACTTTLAALCCSD